MEGADDQEDSLPWQTWDTMGHPSLYGLHQAVLQAGVEVGMWWVREPYREDMTPPWHQDAIWSCQVGIFL